MLEIHIFNIRAFEIASMNFHKQFILVFDRPIWRIDIWNVRWIIIVEWIWLFIKKYIMPVLFIERNLHENFSICWERRCVPSCLVIIEIFLFDLVDRCQFFLWIRIYKSYPELINSIFLFLIVLSSRSEADSIYNNFSSSYTWTTSREVGSYDRDVVVFKSIFRVFHMEGKVLCELLAI